MQVFEPISEKPMTDIPDSLGAMLLRSSQQYGSRIAMTIPRNKTREELTYSALFDQVFKVAQALWELGVRRGDRVCLFSENCAEWAWVDWACQTLGVVLVPVYPTLPAEQAAFIAEDSGAVLFIAGSEAHFERVQGAVKARLIKLLGDGESVMAMASRDSTLTREHWLTEISLTKPADLATIIYTSGTTGNPKGAMLENHSLVWLSRAIHASLPVDEHDTFLSWLPLAHVYERFAGHILPISCGAKIAYAQSLATLANDMVSCSPTIMLIVPRFLESVKERIEDGVKKQPPMKQKLFNLTLSEGKKRLHGGFSLLWPILDKLVASKIRERTGGKLKFFVSGGTAMPMHIYEFFGAFGLKVLQGYGLTETCAGNCFNSPDRIKPASVGEPVQGVEIKLADDGEICIKAPCVMRGYYNQPDATAAAIDADGYFHTGDIGAWDGTHLKITDRKKDILVLANGKNVSPQPIENLVRESSLIAEAVLFGDNQNYVGALIIPDLERIQRAAKEAGQVPPTAENLAENDFVRKTIKAEIDTVNQRLADYEKIKRFEVLMATFSIDTGELTPSLKVKRKVVKEKFEAQIKRLFKED